jgi:hypothetical protein
MSMVAANAPRAFSGGLKTGVKGQREARILAAWRALSNSY